MVTVEVALGVALAVAVGVSVGGAHSALQLPPTMKVLLPHAPAATSSWQTVALSRQQPLGTQLQEVAFGWLAP
jgi:hypothetical protein